ncbi:MAG: anaerobic ribonucleoside triphosphate reductase, partial [Desulfovibrionaceae bacterium]|nr:anaerobic ribonucleoside triphosphate reductase [Desulfovibrionaceae bacterium]
FGYTDTAKAYIIYRSEHTKMRNAESYLMDIYKTLTFSPAIEEDIKRENANIDGDTAMGTMLKYGSEGSKFFIDNYILPKDASAAHIGGDIHIHDKDFYMLTETCCQIDLLNLFKDGFSTGHGYLREPNSIESYAALACIAIQANQNEMHGGQSVPHFDFAMAPGVSKTYVKEYRSAFAAYLKIKLNLERLDAQVKTDQWLKALMITPTLSNDEAFKRAIEKLLPPEDQEMALLAHNYAKEEAYANTDRHVYQAMEALIHNLNTMNSRAGAQVPFSSINYGTDTSMEGRLVMKNLLLATQAGLGNGETSIFPVQIFKVKEGINYAPEDPNYDLFKLAMQTSAKRLFPNFSFLDAPFNKAFYKKGDYNSEVAYMGCRTRVLANVYDPKRQVTCGRGNLSFTSINLPRIGIESQKNINKLFQLLDEKIDLVFRQLLHRFKIQSQRKVRNYPFLMGNGIWLDSEKLSWDDKLGEVLRHGTLTVGFIGLAEMLKSVLGVHHGESEEAQSLGLRIVQHLRDRCDEQSAKTQLNFSLIGTPAESLSGRFVPLDRARYGVLEGITDRDYYTNSFHVPVYYPIKAFKKIQIEAPYHAMTNGGHITYVELDGDTSKNIQAFETIIRYMHDQGVGYGSINHPLDRDPLCGYTGVINDVCPRCGRREGEGLSQEKILELRKKFPHMPRWH